MPLHAVCKGQGCEDSKGEPGHRLRGRRPVANATAGSPTQADRPCQIILKVKEAHRDGITRWSVFSNKNSLWVFRIDKKSLRSWPTKHKGLCCVNEVKPYTRGTA